MDSQTKQILEYLRTGKKLTPLDALQLFGCFRLSARISELRDMGRDMGFEIITDKKEVTDKFGNKKYVGEYWLRETV